MKIQTIIPAGFKSNFVNNNSSNNQNKFNYSQNAINNDIYIASNKSKINFGSLHTKFEEVLIINGKKLFRSGCPTEAQFPELVQMKISDILDFRGYTHAEAVLAAKNNINYHYPIKHFEYLDKDHLAQAANFIAKLFTTSKGSILGHCGLGIDRTGASMLYFELKNGVPDEIAKQHYMMHDESLDDFDVSTLIKTYKYHIAKNPTIKNSIFETNKALT